MKKPVNRKVRNAITKGRNFQKTICEKFAKTYGLSIPDDIRPPYGTEPGSDLKLVSKKAKTAIGLAIECKNKVQLSIWSAIEQSKEHAKKEGGCPCIIFKHPYKMKKAWIAIPLDTYLGIKEEVKYD